MTFQLPAPSLQIDVEPLRQSAFLQFGTVIENPACSTSGLDQTDIAPKIQPVAANQGTALKYPNVSQLVDLYPHAPSQRKAVPVMNLFVCRPRRLRAAEVQRASSGMGREAPERLFDVKILERHPFTTQTFVPMGQCSAGQKTRYLVIVAPTVPGSISTVTPSKSLEEEEGSRLKSLQPGERQLALLRACMPDLRHIRAFVADGSQAITYGAGTWHAPMVVIGEKELVFVVFQSANGIREEDCQEVELQPVSDTGVCVTVPKLD